MERQSYHYGGPCRAWRMGHASQGPYGHVEPGPRAKNPQPKLDPLYGQ